MRCADCAARFFVRLYKNFVGLLTQVKEFLCNMTETDSSKACASIVLCCLRIIPSKKSIIPMSSRYQCEHSIIKLCTVAEITTPFQMQPTTVYDITNRWVRCPTNKVSSPPVVGCGIAKSNIYHLPPFEARGGMIDCGF